MAQSNSSTIYDVASRAQVSISTVSRVLRTPDQVSEATRMRVMEAVEELGFVPRAEAVARARRGTQRIGVLAPFFAYPSFLQRLRGVATALADSTFELVIFNVDTAIRRDGYFASLPIGQRLDGLIIMALPFDETVKRRLVESALETVLVEYRHGPFSSIEIDNEEGGRMAAEHMLAKGHRRFAFVGDSDVPRYAVQTVDIRLRGFRQALAAAGVDLPEQYVALAPHGLEQAHQQALRLLRLARPPDAIFAYSDTQAMGVLKAARELGVAVPDELAVIGFDDVDAADFAELTTVRQPLDESGRIAAELLLARLADPRRHTQHIQLPLSLVCRKTA